MAQKPKDEIRWQIQYKEPERIARQGAEIHMWVFQSVIKNAGDGKEESKKKSANKLKWNRK